MTLNRGYSYREKVGPEGAGRSALEYLSSRYTHSDAAAWLEHFEAGRVELGGERIGPGHLLRPGDALVWHRPPWDEPEVPSDWLLLHEDQDIVAVDKPSGLPTVPGGGFLEHTLLNLVRQRFPEASPMHRLGRETSGIVLFSRNAAAGALLQKSFRDRDLTKVYRALASGVSEPDEWEIRTPIGPVPHPTLGSVHAASPEGKASLSRATVLERRESATLFEVQIETGRPHQIRIHLASVGHPLVGDPLYGAGGLPLPLEPGLPGDGGYFLHAGLLSFLHPRSKEAMTLRAPPPRVLRTSEES